MQTGATIQSALRFLLLLLRSFSRSLLHSAPAERTFHSTEIVNVSPGQYVNIARL